MRAFRLGFATTLAFVLVACSTPPTPPGTLNLVVAGLPAGVAADVTVTGPGGFVQAVAASDVLASLAPGTYVVSVAVVDDGHPIVPAVYDPASGSGSVDVTSGATTDATVTYAHRTLTGTAWVASNNPSTDVLRGYLAGQLEADGAPTPEFVLGGGSTVEYGSIAFDAAGNVWVASFTLGRVYRYPVTELSAPSGSATPEVEIETAAAVPLGLAFDDDGALWVAAYDALLKYAPDQLEIGGALTPQVTIASDGTSLSAPRGLAFDRDGNLWVASALGHRIERYAPAQLLVNGSPTPSVAISGPGILTFPYGVAFDADGALWVSATSANRVLRFDADQLTVSGSPTPAAVITGMNQPVGIAFDHGGALWVVREPGATASVVRIVEPATLVGEVAAEFAVTIDLDPTAGGFPTFFPPPASVPLRLP